MTNQAIAVMGALFGGWVLLVGLSRSRLPAQVVLKCFIGLATLFFVLAAAGPRAGDNQVNVVLAGFAILGALMAAVVVLDAHKR